MPIRLSSVALALLVGAGCTCRSEKEKGSDLVTQKLEFVEGAAEALKDRGNSVGRGAAQGLGETLKGVGSGVKDVLTPAVSVVVAQSLRDQEVAVGRANAKLLGADARVELTLTGKKPLSGGLRLAALDASGNELGRATAFEHRELDFSEPQLVPFEFPDSVRFSEAKSFELFLLPPKQLLVGDGLAGAAVNQLAVQAHEVKFYAMFEKGFAGTLQLRAYDASGQELGRSSSALGVVTRPADSAEFLSFSFDPSTSLARVVKFELRGVRARK
jgi:hypothetical protein